MAREQATRVFRAALDLPPTERAGFLERACGGDATLRAEVDGLLASRDTDAPTEALERPPGGSRDESAGSRVGPYRLLGLVGRGGMGAVYRAVREDAFEKVVALKRLRAGFES